jgi:hypothetical protein
MITYSHLLLDNNNLANPILDILRRKDVKKRKLKEEGNLQRLSLQVAGGGTLKVPNLPASTGY